MGQVKTVYIKHLGQNLVEKYPGRFTNNFDKNKEELAKVVKLNSKKMRNEVAGYIVDVIRKQNNPKGIEMTYRPKEEVRGRRRRRK